MKKTIRKSGRGGFGTGKGVRRDQKREQKQEAKLRRKRQKLRAKRYRRISNRLDFCLVLTCFLAFLAAAGKEIWEQRKEENASGN